MHDLQGYKTVEEKACEWDITPRHIQYLCRRGKIDGAAKRAGAWFIPDGAPMPLKNTKSSVKEFRFVGTKKNVFESAISLFVSKGFDNVSIRDIASAVGIRQSTIYNHFKSKQEILDTIYDFYCHYYLKNRPDMGHIDLLLQNGSLLDIIGSIRYDFEEEYQRRMSDITKIILQRVAIDNRAREISKSMMIDSGLKYVEDVFNKGVEIGRFAPFNTRAISVFINSIRVFTLYNWIIDPSPDNVSNLAKDEQALYKYAAELVKDLKPVADVANA